MDDKDEKKKPAEKPISLKPLKFEEAVEGLLKVKPTPAKIGEAGGESNDTDSGAEG